MKFKKGDIVYHWGANGKVKFFVAKEVDGEKVMHPYGGYYYYSSIFTLQEMKEQIEQCYNHNKEMVK